MTLFRNFPVKLFKAGPKRPQFIFTYILIPSLQHLLTFLQESIFIGASLPNMLISIQAQDKLRLSLYMIIFCDFRRYVTVYLDDFLFIERLIDHFDVLGCDGAGWVPFRFEIEHHIWVFVERKVLAEVIEITECFYGAEVG